MENINIGTISLMISDKLRKTYFGKKNINEARENSQSFIKILNESPLLELEFNVFNSLENKHIDNDLLAARYIDNSIGLFETYTIDELNEERKKIEKFYDENIEIDEKRNELYENINNVIVESLKPYDEVNVDVLHESFTYVLNHIKTPSEKRGDVINESIEGVNDSIIEIAVRKFNEKFNHLDEDDKNLLIKLIKSSDDEKRRLFEEYKSENLKLLEAIDMREHGTNKTLVIEKINKMDYDPKTVNESIIKLHELKNGLV